MSTERAGPYDGSVSVFGARHARLAIHIEANNVRAKVYITREQAADLRDALDDRLSLKAEGPVAADPSNAEDPTPIKEKEACDAWPP